jgi:hypothetical protein
MKKLVATIGAVALLTASWGAIAANKFEAGTLTCKGGEGVGLILGSQKTYACSFTPTNGAPPESYEATVTKIGLDIGVTGETTMVWTVLSAEGPIDPRGLAGDYVGAAADAALGIGAGAKVLVGGSKNQITLQPLSVQGQTGVNLALGVAEFSLR